MSRWILAIGLVSQVSVGCAAEVVDESAIDNEADTEDEEQKADGITYPVGSYDGIAGTAGDFTRLVLMTDKTFHREQQVLCVTAPCNPIGKDGTYKFTKSTTTSKKYLRFYAKDGADLGRYAWTLSSGGKLKLTPTDGRPAFSLAQAKSAWCSAATQCKVQNLAQPKCPGKWQCTSNVCDFSECAAPTSNACEKAGGACVGLTPTNCKDGEVGDATKYSCGGPIGVMCCLPKTGAPVCDKVGTSTEGWYWPDGGKICLAPCKGTTAKCDAVGSRSEGWYAEGKGCLGANLIGWDDCDSSK